MDDGNDKGLLPFQFPKRDDINSTVRDLDGHLHGMRACYEVMKKSGADLQSAITEFESSTIRRLFNGRSKVRVISEKSTQFGIAANGLLLACEKYLASADADALKLVRILQEETEKTAELEKLTQDLQQQQPTSIKFNQIERYELDDRDTATDIGESDSLTLIRKTIDVTKFSFEANTLQRENTKTFNDSRERRARIPNKPNISMNAWSLLKSSIGKDLSRIPMPVHFNEPITFLQRLTEEFEYAELLDVAAEIEDTHEQIAYIAAFSISVYSGTADRAGKPFNPLLGETYEFDRKADLGWRSIAEQVSHHPPISALHCEGRGWELWQDCCLTTKFRGKSLQIQPSGSCNCKFTKTGTAYTWHKVGTTVHNIFVGKMWIDQQGQVEIEGSGNASGVRCTLTYIPYALFSSETQRRVNGNVTDKEGNLKWYIKGHWDRNVEIAPYISAVEKGAFTEIWRKIKPDPESPLFYYFSKFTCELNEEEEDTAPTDSRRRPDLRMMEVGNWDDSNIEKLRLEEKQRRKRRTYASVYATDEASIDEHEPLWFSRQIKNKKATFSYKHTYWDAKEQQDWSNCPDLFS